MPEDEGQPPGDETGSQPAPGEPEPEDVETWPPEGETRRTPQSPSPDHEQARQGPRDPAPSAASHEGGRRPGMSDADARNWAAGAHLASLVALLGVPSIVGPLVVWLVKREDHPFVGDQARESLNFQISVIIYTVVGVIAALALTLATLGMGLLVVIPVALIFVVGVLVLPIVAAIKASEGERYRYPLTMRLISGSEGPARERR